MATFDTPSRRSVLKIGGAGVFAAAFLAACSDDEPVGVSGTPSPTTDVTPTVPTKPPTDAQLAEVQVQLHTLASVEALVASVYADRASEITDPELAPHVARFGADHTAAATAVAALTEDGATPEPNAWLQENLVDPAADSLNTAANVQTFLSNLESSLVATYVNAMTDILDPTMRRTLMTFGAAAARRVTLLRDGEVPEGAVYPSADLISNDAFLGGTEEATGDSTPGDAESDTPDQADNQSD
ncbi:MAG: hypothetical protein KF906_11525 [Actinobacteria bacterium]|nr:hypothetical protein [Actinomycetota bacterium]